MKNLKKLISVIIAVIMLVSSFATVAAVDYADVESTNSYAKAIKVLSGLGIAQGDGNGNFNPSADVKRSEMVAFVCRMMGEEDIARSSSSSAFSDVASNHWAAGYIAWGVNRGIVNGMGDGTFAPDASVKYKDAVVMIMRALGFDRIAQRAENGGYPTGYLKLASQHDVLTNAGYDNDKAATREIIAQLIYNGLTAPMVDVSSYGVSVEDDKYVIYNGDGIGENKKDYRTLLTYVNHIWKVQAEVTATPKSAPSTYIDSVSGDYKVKLTVKDNYGYSDAAVSASTALGSLTPTVYVGATEAADLLGYTVDAYIAFDEELNENKIVALVVDNRSVIETTITENLDTAAISGNKFAYFADLNDRDKTELDLNATRTYYYNGQQVTIGGAITDDFATETAFLAGADEIKLVGARKDANYSKIFVTDYQYYIVDSVDVEDKFIKFDTVTRGSLELDADTRNDDDFFYGLYDAEGKEIGLEDIAEGDVLNIAAPLSTMGLDNAPYMDIYVSNETITGKVGEQKSNGDWVIDGEAYTALATAPIAFGDEGIFYLTIDGKILKKDASTAITKNFAFLVGIEEKDEFQTKSYTLRLFTKDGIADVKAASTVKYVAGNGSYTNYKTDPTATSVQTALFGAGSTFANAVANKVDTTAAAAVTAAEATAATRFFTYKVNSNGEINEIRVAGGASDELIAQNKLSTKAKYNADFEEFGGEAIGEAPLFSAQFKATQITSGVDTGKYAANVNVDKLVVADFASMEDDAELRAMLYTVKGENELAAALTIDKVKFGLEASPLAVLKSTGLTLDADDNQVAALTFVQSGEVVTLSCDNDEVGTSHGLVVGDIFQYSVDADGEIAEVAKVFDYTTKALTAYALAFETDDNNKGNMAFVFGMVTFDDAGNIILASDIDAEADNCDKACVGAHAADCAAKNATGKVVTGNKFKFSDVEGATYGLVDAYYIANNASTAGNGVKVISVNNLKETVKPAAAYAAVAKVDENGNRVEDVIEIAYQAADWDAVEAFGTWEINPEA